MCEWKKQIGLIANHIRNSCILELKDHREHKGQWFHMAGAYTVGIWYIDWCPDNKRV